MQARVSSLRFLCGLAVLLLLPASASSVGIEWVVVGDPGNAPDTPSSNCLATDCGSVADSYRISKYEITNSQYAEFLNAKALSDPLALYSANMGLGTQGGGISRSGSDGSYMYTVNPGFSEKPVNHVTFYDALRFANWLHNGQGNGDTETGAYTLLGGTATPTNGTIVMRNPGAKVFLPSENEWYKAAYYDGLSATYFDFPAGSDTPTVCSAPTATPNRANCAAAALGATDVGSYTGSASPSGTFDQGGNVWEWNEQIVNGSGRSFRGGSLLHGATRLAASAADDFDLAPHLGSAYIGFRVASVVPEPGTSALVMIGLVAFTSRRNAAARKHSS